MASQAFRDARTSDVTGDPSAPDQPNSGAPFAATLSGGNMHRRLILALSLSALAITAVAGMSVAQKKDDMKMKKMKPSTVMGTLIDTKCYGMMPSNIANDHETPKGTMPKCATACANMGIPTAVLTDDGDVIVLVAPAAAFADHMSHTIKVTGMKVFDGSSIIVDRAEVKGKDGKWSEVKIATMM